MGPVRSVSARLAQLVLPGDNPDVANMILEHENGALSNLTASYASASEFYMMNVYGKEASAYYDLFSGLRHLKRGETTARAVPTETNDTIREELEEFAHCVRNGTKPETDGYWATRNLAVIKAGVRSAREGRTVDVAEVAGERGVVGVKARDVPGQDRYRRAHAQRGGARGRPGLHLHSGAGRAAQRLGIPDGGVLRALPLHHLRPPRRRRQRQAAGSATPPR